MGEAPRDARGTWRDAIFKRRGALLAVPALGLAAFGKPSGASIAFGVPLALAGEGLRCWAVGYSGVTTRSDRVTAPGLVTAGPYAYMRNPLYAGNFITALGFAIAFTGGTSRKTRACLTVAGLGSMLAVYAAIVPREEAYLRSTFGAAFDDYTRRVPRIWPRATPAEPALGTYDARVLVHAESRTFVWLAVMLTALAAKALRET